MVREIKFQFTNDVHLVVQWDGAGGGWVSSNICEDIEDKELVAISNVLESMVLAHACAGVDIGSNAYCTGLQTAFDAMSNAL